MNEFNHEFDETNFVPNEQNSSFVLNNYSLNSNSNKKSTDEINKNSSSNASTKKAAKTFNIKTVSSLMFACAMIVVMQIGIYVPIFSEVFSPMLATESHVYVKSINTKANYDSTNKYLLVQAIPGDKFTNFNSFYFELYDISNDSVVKDYAIINKGDLSTSWASFPFKKSLPVYKYQLKIYCSTSKPKDISYSSTFVKDEINYYLIYTHAEDILF